MEMMSIRFLFLFIPCIALAGEREIAENHCKGESEVVQVDFTRIDCIENGYAIEYDYASKWYNGVTQCMHYGLISGLKPSLRLILRRPNDQVYVDRAVEVIFHYRLPIKLETIKVY